MPASPMRVARRESRAAAAALAFLTRLPVGRAIVLSGPDLGRAAHVFPLVGALLGLAVGATAVALAGRLSAVVAAPFALIVGALLTGAMHLDALADTADALGARSRAHALEIMRDPRIGSYGTTAIVLCLLLESAALATIARAGNVGPVVAAFALSRAAAPAVACVLPPARSGQSLAQPLAGRHVIRAVVGLVLASTTTLGLAPHEAPRLILASAACLAAAAIVSARRFAGVTGDTLGATILITETMCLAAAAGN